MGLFKTKVMPKVADIFTAEDLLIIKDVIGSKAKNNEYGKYNDLAKTLLQVADAPEKDYSQREWNGIIFSAGAMTKVELSLAPMLNSIIDRFHAFKGKQVIIVSLTVDESNPRKRLLGDVHNGLRAADATERSIAGIEVYQKLDTVEFTH